MCLVCSHNVPAGDNVLGCYFWANLTTVDGDLKLRQSDVTHSPQDRRPVVLDSGKGKQDPTSGATRGNPAQRQGGHRQEL